jgi:hypothetical protein
VVAGLSGVGSHKVVPPQVIKSTHGLGV